MVEDVKEDFETIQTFLDHSVIPMFRAFTNQTNITFDDPDMAMLEIATKVLSKLEGLECSLDDLIAINETESDSSGVDLLEVVENMC